MEHSEKMSPMNFIILKVLIRPPLILLFSKVS